MSAITEAPAGQVWAWSVTSNAAVLIDDVDDRDELEDLHDDLVGDDDLDDDPAAGTAGTRVACTACRAATTGGHTPDQARARAAAHDQVHHQGRPTARIRWAPATTSSSTASSTSSTGAAPDGRDARVLALLAAAGIRVEHHQADVGLDFDPGPVQPGYAYDPGRRVPEQDCLGVWLAAQAGVATLTAAAPDLAEQWVHVAPSAVLRATRPDGHPRGCLYGVAIPRRHHDQLLERLTSYLQGGDVVDPELDDDDVDDGTGPHDVLRADGGRLLTVADLQAYLHQMPPSAPVLLAAGPEGTGGRAPLEAAWPALYAADGAPISSQDPADVHFAVVLGPA